MQAAAQPPSPPTRRWCHHDETVRRLLAVLYPEQMKVWSLARNRHNVELGKFTVPRHSLRQIDRRNLYRTMFGKYLDLDDSSSSPYQSPLKLRNKLLRDNFYHFRLLPNLRSARQRNLLRDTEVRVVLTGALSVPQYDDDDYHDELSISRRLSVHEQSLIADELLSVLRSVLAAQRPDATSQTEPPPLPPEGHNDPSHHRWFDDGRHMICSCRASQPVTVHLSQRYWQHTFPWLCDILSVVCAKFIVFLWPTPVCAPRHALSVRFDPFVRRRDVCARVCALRWRLATALGSVRQRRHRCTLCVTRIFRQQLLPTLRSIVTKYNVDNGLGVLVTCQFVRMYRSQIATATTSQCCEDEQHDDDDDDDDDDDGTTRNNLLIINMRYGGTLYGHNETWTRRYTAAEAGTIEIFPVYDSTAVSHLARFARYVAIRMLAPQSSTAAGIVVSCKASTEWFESIHMLPSILALLGEDTHLQVSYDASPPPPSSSSWLRDEE